MLCDKNLCSGCTACVNICPVHCITMQEDGEGFLHPDIDTEQCVGCGLCGDTCPVLHTPLPQCSGTTAYAAINRNNSERESSTSGGVFIQLAKWTIRHGGIVFGAAYQSDGSVSHTWADREFELARFQGAKYAQSILRDTFKEVKAFLEEERYVLFSGTPCQTLGLKNYLGVDCDRLILVDFICHGVPSPKVWQHYIDYRAEQDHLGSRAKNICLRSKSTGWQRYSVVFSYDERSYSSVFADDPYMQGFIRDLYIRPSCHECPAKGIERISDFTLGDYWGIGSQHPEMDDDLGTSVVLVHSEKAKRIWFDLSDMFYLKEVQPVEALTWNPVAVQSTPYSPKREEFFERYKKEDFSDLVWELAPKAVPQKVPMFTRIRKRLMQVIKRF